MFTVSDISDKDVFNIEIQRYTTLTMRLKLRRWQTCLAHFC